MEKLYSLKECAQASGRLLATIQQAVKREQLLTTKMGESHFVSESDLLNYLNEYDPQRADEWLQRNGEI